MGSRLRSPHRCDRSLSETRGRLQSDGRSVVSAPQHEFHFSGFFWWLLLRLNGELQARDAGNGGRAQTLTSSGWPVAIGESARSSMSSIFPVSCPEHYGRFVRGCCLRTCLHPPLSGVVLGECGCACGFWLLASATVSDTGFWGRVAGGDGGWKFFCSKNSTFSQLLSTSCSIQLICWYYCLLPPVY